MCDNLEKIYSMIGIARKAGKTSTGTLGAKTSLVRGRACLLIMSGDIAEKTKESLVSSCEKRRIPWLVLGGDRYNLGVCVGKAYRVAITVNDRNIAQAIIDCIRSMGEEVESTGVVEWPK